MLMKILRTTSDMDLNLINNPDFKTNLGWEENFKEFEDKTLRTIINPVANYETTRYIHEPYTANNILQSDIWFYFYFIDASNGYTKGLDYSLANITNEENAMLLKASTTSFFRLEFFSTTDKATQKLIFAKTLPIPLGQRVFLTNIHDYIHVPVFMGNNYTKSENMYMFWFQDQSVYSGTTFYMSARFFDGKDGSISVFANKDTGSSHLNITNDLYYQIDLNTTYHSYTVSQYNGSKGSRVGQRATPINFYQAKG